MTVTHRRVFAITLPMTLAYLTTPLLGMTDIAVVGRIGDAETLGGLVVGALIFDFVFAVCNFLRAGTTGLTAQALGAGDTRKIEAVFLRAALLALVIGGLLILAEPLVMMLGLAAIAPGPTVGEAAATYVFVRMFSAPFALANYAILGSVLGRGRSRLALGLQIIVNGTNIVLSIVFGLMLQGGIAGVALGTVCGEAAGCLAGLMVLARGLSGARCPTLTEILDRTGFLQMLGVNRDIMIRSFCLLAGFALFTRLGAGFGPVTLAANGLLMTIFMTGSYFLDGLATAAEQLAGQALGARRRSAFDQTVRLTSGWGLVVGLLVGLTTLFGGTILIDLLTTDLQVRMEARRFLPFAAATPLVGALAFVMDGLFIGATWSGAMRDMMILSLAVFILAGYGLTPLAGNQGLWLAFEIFLALRGGALAAMLPRQRDRAFTGST
ncbi:MATE family efflux transporter [Jiella sp. MQZ9-1]|uniref:MATE family efflux transporter n=1 Tax=Jiella flava TaxID=2816857 RepID=A0A939FUI0_9HYPH|nr:MATE family efflux transporter [Jiella flava]MBO0662183.1 MATE family efflux transporter [Jiella flava]MCD2470987.1 MATE family efflux transporter [Jiella flava]